MFDFAWSEIALIGVVALIAIGPKDMPVAIKAVTNMIKKARRMASEFQTHVDDMMKDANLGDVRDQINELRTMDIKGRILKAVDGDGSMRTALNDDPFKTAATPAAMPPASAEPLPAADITDAVTPAIPEPAHADLVHMDAAPAGPAQFAAPAFIPPADVPVPAEPVASPAAPPAAPAFIPPNAAQPRT